MSTSISLVTVVVVVGMYVDTFGQSSNCAHQTSIPLVPSAVHISDLADVGVDTTHITIDAVAARTVSVTAIHLYIPFQID